MADNEFNLTIDMNEASLEMSEDEFLFEELDNNELDLDFGPLEDDVLLSLEPSDTDGEIEFLGDQTFLHLPIATRELLGGVIIGDRLSITEEGLLSADEQIPEDDYTLITNLDINQILNS